ncbi:MAG: trypsin-like peptidase domain-containing protein [Deltaproteobacteria bacterium]|nr:trypsin-like peptidase domain-containing protein [Deltaproteobacteria bacterium]
MFSKAVEKVERFIRPVVISKRYYSGEVETNGGTITVVNKEGWFLSAAHLFEVVPLFKKHTQEAAEQTAKIEELRKEDTKSGRRELKRLRPNPGWITVYSIWTGKDDQKIVDMNVVPEADILIGRLEPFDPADVAEYPVFKDPKGPLKIGTSLCKIGFAFPEIKADYDPAANKFNVNFQNLVPFPLDGIYTRNILFKTPEERNIEVKFIETSSAGLRGQSGGPVFDREGIVWGIQSYTAHIPLDFHPAIEREGKRVEENQFLNVSWAIHPDVTAKFLIGKGVKFSTGG